MADPGSPPRILVVDDDGVNREMAVRMLRRLGYLVEVASHGAEAIDAIGRSRFDVVFMDCQMPVLDGYEAAKSIRRAEEAHASPRLPIVAMTASESDSSRQRCLDAGMDDHLDKPFDTTALAEVLRRWAPRDGVPAATTTQSCDASATIDPDQLARYAAAGDQGSDLVDRLVERFIASAGEDVTAIRRAMEAGNLAELARAVHDLIGSSAVVGARGLAALGRRIEAMAEAGVLEAELGVLLGEVDEEMGRVTLALRAAATALRRES